VTKLSRDSVTGKLIACSNIDGKLLRGGCCPTCNAYQASPCPAVYQWNLPEVILVDFSGIMLAQQQVSGRCYQKWSPYGGWTACVYDCAYWCTTVGNGSWGGVFHVPVKPYWGYNNEIFYCGGNLTLQDAVYVTVQSYYGQECSSVYSEGLRDVTIGVGVRPFISEGEHVYEINCTVTVEGVGTIFQGASEPYPTTPAEDRHGYAGIIHNSIEDTYDPEPVGECNYIFAVPGWGGSVDITTYGTYTFPFWIQEFGRFVEDGPFLNGIMLQSGNSVGAWMRLYDSNFPNSTHLVVEYKVTYAGVQTEIFRQCFYSGDFVFLGKTKELGQHLGYTTIEVLNIYSPEIPNIVWDQSKGAAGWAWGNFDIQDKLLYVSDMTPLPEDDSCLPCSNDVCYTAQCQVQLEADGGSADEAVICFDWRKDDGPWITGGQAIANPAGQAIAVTTECIGINLVNPPVPFVVEFRVTDVSKAEYLYKSELNSVSTCICGPIMPPPDCITFPAPEPDPPTHAEGTPFTVFVAGEGQYYVVVLSDEPTSSPPTEEGYEYYFACVEDSAFDSGWRSNDSVAGLSYPNGTAQEPRQYWVGCDTAYTFSIKIRDTACQKETGWSAAKGTGG